MTDAERVFTDIASRHDRCFWLDGGGGRPWSGRRSLLGWCAPDDVSFTYDGPTGQVTRHAAGRSEPVGDDIFAVLGASLSGDPGEHWVGYFGYAARPDLPARPGADGMPDAVWMRARNVRVIEHAPAAEVAAAPQWGDLPAVPGWYANGFAEVQEQLRAGNSYEVNLTYREQTAASVDPVAAYLRLRRLNPAPYAGFLRHHDAHLLSSSPERFAVVRRDRTVETKPIKGTTPRGATPEEDARLRAHLASDPKLRAENLMITDLLRNDLAIVCAPGTVEVPTLMEVESYPGVHQLVTTVRGRLRDEVGTVAALRALFPAGSMTGAPKQRTMEIIDRVEAAPRGVYSGAFGWISGDGRADLGVVIRSLTSATPGVWTHGTGGGITVRSDLAEEWAETQWKAERLRAALITMP